MAYVVINRQGRFLASKKWVELVDQAQVWDKVSEAKLIAKRVPEAVGVQEIRRILWGSAVYIEEST